MANEADSSPSGESADTDPRKLVLSIADGDPADAEVLATDLQPEDVQRVRSVLRHQSFSGPIPPPQILAAYDEALPGTMDRIVKMAESEQQHRQWMERRAISFTFYETLVGQIFGLIVALCTIGGGLYAMLNGHEVGGTLIAGAGLAGLVSVFILGRDGIRRGSSPKVDGDSPAGD